MRVYMNTQSLCVKVRGQLLVSTFPYLVWDRVSFSLHRHSHVGQTSWPLGSGHSPHDLPSCHSRTGITDTRYRARLYKGFEALVLMFYPLRISPALLYVYFMPFFSHNKSPVLSCYLIKLTHEDFASLHVGTPKAGSTSAEVRSLILINWSWRRFRGTMWLVRINPGFSARAAANAHNCWAISLPLIKKPF